MRFRGEVEKGCPPKPNNAVFAYLGHDDAGLPFDRNAAPIIGKR